MVVRTNTGNQISEPVNRCSKINSKKDVEIDAVFDTAWRRFDFFFVIFLTSLYNYTP